VDVKKGKMKGQAFVTLATPEMATEALHETHGYLLRDKPIVVVREMHTHTPAYCFAIVCQIPLTSGVSAWFEQQFARRTQPKPPQQAT